MLRETDSDRLAELIPVRYGRMLASPFAFYRGAANVMAADLAVTPATGVRIQICGDCHLENFGGFATPERNMIFDINDFDETLPGPWEWDIKRLAASFVLAARAHGMSDENGREAATACTRFYRERLAAYARMHPLDVWYARIGTEDFLSLLDHPGLKAMIRSRIAKAAKRDARSQNYPAVAVSADGRLEIREAPPLVYHPEEARAKTFRSVLESILKAYRRTLPDERQVLLDRYRLEDAALKVVGIGSVGRACWVALLVSASNEPLFLQLKQACPSVVEPYAGKSVYAHHGQRVVVGQRLMQPASDVFLGWVTARGRNFYVRQLYDAKIKPLVETFDARMLVAFGRACGWALARAHAKAGDAWTISGYLGEQDEFDQALGAFALAYADQVERDYARLEAAVKTGMIAAVPG